MRQRTGHDRHDTAEDRIWEVGAAPGAGKARQQDLPPCIEVETGPRMAATVSVSTGPLWRQLLA